MTSHAETRAADLDQESPSVALEHVLVVGGTSHEWQQMSSAQWAARIDGLGRYCASLAIPWLTIRVYADGDGAAPAPDAHSTIEAVAACSVIVDPFADGRQRFAEAMQRLERGADLTEATVAHALYAPADSEPDLVVVLGPPTQLPPSLVWELAYAELVFVEAAWNEFGVDHLAAAVSEYAGRRRRFGGLDPD